MATTTNVSNLKINVLTKEQYNAATKDENQLYLITNNTTEFLALTGGTLTGQLILAADPTENLGAATKQYVDAQITTANQYTDTQVATKAPAYTYGTTAYTAGSTSLTTGKLYLQYE